MAAEQHTAKQTEHLNQLTRFQRDILHVIAGRTDNPCGLDIKADLEYQYQDGEVNHGRLYPNLDTLVEMGLIEKGEQDARTNAYTLTTDGEHLLQAQHAWQASMLEGLE